MMKLKFIDFEGIRYLAPESFKFCKCSVADYPSYCGAGNGFGDKIVSEKLGGKPCSHICHIHDKSWDIAKNNFMEFLISNVIFLFNFTIYLFRNVGFLRGCWMFLKMFLYVGSVSTFGFKIFKKIKKDQEHD